MIRKHYIYVRILFLGAALVLLLTDLLFTHNALYSGIFVSLAASGTIGLAHGGLDWSLAKRWGLITNLQQSIIFILVYLLCIVLTLVVWYLIPSVALSIFLLMSVIHFGGDWQEELGLCNAYILGICLLCLPTLNFYNEVKSIFELLLSAADASWLANLMYYLAMTASPVLGLKLIYLTLRGNCFWMVLEVSCLILLSILLTPLVFFSIYFCFLHAPKHWITMRKLGTYQSFSQGLYTTLWPTLCCIIFGLMTFYYLTETMNYTDSLCKTLFIGLAALTVPHWILVEIYGKTRR